jgi:O-antigen/teichoic acid export membrane protein
MNFFCAATVNNRLMLGRSVHRMKYKWLATENRIGIRAGTIRAVALVLRFPCLLWLSSHLSPEDFGGFIVYQTIVVIFTFLVGLELHQVAIRRYVRASVAEAAIVKSVHIRLGLKIAAVAAVALAGILMLVLPVRLLQLTLLIGICYTEYHQTEFGRYLIAESRTVASNILSLLRNAAWLPLSVLVLILQPGSGLTVLMAAWLGANLLSMILERIWRQPLVALPEPLSVGLLKTHARESAWFYAVVVAVMVRDQFDRLLIAGQLGLDDAGAYGFYATLVSFSLTIIQVLLIAENTRLFLSRTSQEAHSLIRLTVQNAIQSVILAALAGVLLYALLNPLLTLIDRPLLISYKPVFIVLAISTLVQAANNTLTLTLTALNEERNLGVIEIFSGCVSLLINLLLIDNYGSISCAFALGISATLAVAGKSWIIWRAAKR